MDGRYHLAVIIIDMDPYCVCDGTLPTRLFALLQHTASSTLVQISLALCPSLMIYSISTVLYYILLIASRFTSRIEKKKALSNY